MDVFTDPICLIGNRQSRKLEIQNNQNVYFRPTIQEYQTCPLNSSLGAKLFQVNRLILLQIFISIWHTSDHVKKQNLQFEITVAIM